MREIKKTGIKKIPSYLARTTGNCHPQVTKMLCGNNKMFEWSMSNMS